MARSLSLYRRRVGVVDLNLRQRAGIASYNFQAAANFDGTFTTFQNVPSYGFRSNGVPDISVADSQFRGLTRFLFNPSDYTVAVPAVDDTKPFWVRIQPITNAGIVGAAEAMHLILPYSSTLNRALNLAGSVPNTALELQLPGNVNNALFQVNDTNNLFVAFEPNGAEFQVPSLINEFTTFETTYQTFSQLFLRGSSSPTLISISCRIINTHTALSSFNL